MPGLLHSLRSALILGLTFWVAAPFAATKPAGNGAIELSFIKGDTQNGTRVRLRILGDSIFYHRTLFSPGATPRESEQALLLDIQRQRTLQGVMGELPRYPTFGSCYGEGMRYYLVETDQGKFYRSLPQQSGKCYLDEPNIFSLFDDLDDLLTPPATPKPPPTAS